MAVHHDDHGQSGHGGHSGSDPHLWVNEHMSGIIMPMGKWLEGVIEKYMFFLVNGIFQRFAIIYLVLTTPLLLIEFVLRHYGS